MALSRYLFVCLIACVSMVARIATAAGTIFANVVQWALVEAFRVRDLPAPTSASETTPAVIGLTEVRAYEARRQARVAAEMSLGRGLCLAA